METEWIYDETYQGEMNPDGFVLDTTEFISIFTNIANIYIINIAYYKA